MAKALLTKAMQDLIDELREHDGYLHIGALCFKSDKPQHPGNGFVNTHTAMAIYNRGMLERVGPQKNPNYPEIGFWRLKEDAVPKQPAKIARRWRWAKVVSTQYGPARVATVGEWKAVIYQLPLGNGYRLEIHNWQQGLDYLQEDHMSIRACQERAEQFINEDAQTARPLETST